MSSELLPRGLEGGGLISPPMIDPGQGGWRRSAAPCDLAAEGHDSLPSPASVEGKWALRAVGHPWSAERLHPPGTAVRVGSHSPVRRTMA